MVQHEVFKNKYKNLGIKPQPVIFIVDAKEFYLVYDSLFFKFNSVIKALDTVFKVFFVLNLEYPKEIYNFWLFIQIYFYNIPDTKNISSAVTSLITQLNNS